MEIISKLERYVTSKIVMLPSTSEDISVKILYQCIHILNNKEGFNGLKCSTKMQNKVSLLKYQSRIYHIQRNYDVNHRGMKI